MTLDNLLKIGQLKHHDPEPAEIQRLIQAARRNIADSRVTAISAETRFDAAYKAIMQAALAARMEDDSEPGRRVNELLLSAPGWSRRHAPVFDHLERILRRLELFVRSQSFAVRASERSMRSD